MSKEEDLFKQHLDDMFSSQQFEMGADNWSGMEKLLNQQQRKRRGFFILFSGLGVLLLGTLVWLLMPATEKTATNVAATSNTTIPKTYTDKPATTVAPAIAATSAEPASTSNKPSKPTSNTVPKTEKTKPIENPEPVTAPVANTIKPQAPLVAEPLPSKQNSYATPQDPVSNTPVDNATNSPTKSSDPLSQSSHEPAITAADISTDMPAVSTGNISSLPTPITATVAATPTASETPVNAGLQENVAAVTNTNEPANTVNDTILTKPLVALDSLLTTPIAAKPDTDYVAKKHLRFALAAGISAISGWKVDNTRDAAGINPLAGAHLYYPLSSELDLSVGLQYTTVNNLGYSKYTATVSHLDLGRVDESTVFTPLRLHYVVLPIKFFLHVSPRQSIGAGINAAYLLTADSRVETFTYGYNSVTRTSSQIKKGYTQGFRNFDAQVAAYYNYKLSKKLEAQACIMYGLMDVKTGEALPSKGFERNSGAKLSLFYNLFER